MTNPYKVVVFSSNDPFAGIMLRGLLNSTSYTVEKVYFEKECMGGMGSVEVFRKVIKSSGWRYALYQGFELLFYRFMTKILTLKEKALILTPLDICKSSKIDYDHIDIAINRDGFHDRNECDILFCFRFSKILKGPLLSIPKLASINFHGSLLPKYKGLGSIFQALHNKESEIGGSFHLMVQKIDEGHIITRSKFPIDYTRSVSYHHLKVYYESSLMFDRLADNLNNNVREENKAEEKQYFSFPKKSDVSSFKGKLLELKDLITAWKLFSYYKI